MIGNQILNYKIESLLGKGGMGTVFLGKHLQMERKVAIKMLHPDLSSNESLRERFKNEASALAHLQHPNIVALYDYYESSDGLFLVMEYVDGMELGDHINNVSGPIEEKNAINFFNQILDGFHNAHEGGIVHRDIKPSNILITSEHKVKIMDFGIAKIVDSEKSLTKTGTQIGTVFYMSPEQVKGEKVDHRSDIYSLGVTLFQMVTGQCPYSKDTTEFQIYQHIVNDPLPDPRTIYPGISDHIVQLIAKATQKKVEDRFQSCQEFRSALSDKTLKPDIKEPVPSPIQETVIKPPQKEDHENLETPVQLKPTKRKKNNLMLIVIAIGVLMIGTYVIVQIDNKTESSAEEKAAAEAAAIVEGVEEALEDGYSDEMDEAAEEETVLTASNVKEVFDDFISAWNNRDAEKQINHLSHAFTYIDQAKEQDYSDFVAGKRRITQKYAWMAIDVQNVSIDVYPDYAIVSFYQHYNSPKYESWGTCEYYFREENGTVKLYQEKYNRDRFTTK